MSLSLPTGRLIFGDICSPARAAESLKAELEHCDINADVNDGYGLAVVSIWPGLTVWSDGLTFWWHTGGWDARHGRAVYAWHAAEELERVARRVALRYADLRKAHPLPAARAGAHRAAPV
ncbi:hypothetical protein [Streptosporangium sp. NPDC048865]|uniref:hypothetical protein n=1 Tax=Streptosporangium sp. NPDC048865 TaxID=3155766 RepID=UPI00341C0646